MATKKAESTAKQTDSPKVKRLPAEDILGKFLIEKGITLVYPPITSMMKRVEDGSVLILQPKIGAKYIDE